MLTRRDLLVLTGATALMIATGPAAFAPPAFAQSPDRALAFFKTSADQLVAIVNGPGAPRDKRPRLQQVLDASVDVDAIARFCLGPFWRKATPEQQQQYTALFHEVLLNNVTGSLGEYQGVKLVIGRAQARGADVVISTTVERPNNPPAQVDWVVSEETGAPKIIDVIAEGTSLRLTQRSDYASFLHRNGDDVAALITAMRHQIAAAQSG